MRYFRLLLALAILAGIGAGVVWFNRFRPLSVAVALVEHDVPVRVFGLGTVEARIASRVGFEVAGSLADIRADHGDHVPRGALLAVLDPTAQQARVAKAAAGLASAEAAQLRAAAVLERAQAQSAQRRAVAARRRELATRGAASAEAAEQAETDAVMGAADVAVAQADLAVARAVLADAMAARQAESTTLAKHSLIAPFDALVIARLREAGSALAPGEAVFSLIDPATIWGLVHVDESRAGAIREGQPAEVRLRSLPGQVFRARVARIGLESDRVTEERRVYLRCENCPARPVLGEQIQAEIETARLPAARLVPEVAVEGFDGETGLAWVIADGVLARRDLRFTARTLDARLVLDPATPATIAVITRIDAGFREGRAASVAP